MSIISSIGNAISSAYNYAKSAFSGAANTVSNQAASVANAFGYPKTSSGGLVYNNPVNNAFQVGRATGLTPAQSALGLKGGVSSNGLTYAPGSQPISFTTSPVSYSAGTRLSSDYASSSYSPTYSGAYLSPQMPSSTQVSAGTIGAGTPTVVMPSAPSVTNYHGDIAGANVGVGANPTTGMIETATTGTTDANGKQTTEEQGAKKAFEDYISSLKAPPSSADAYNRAQQESGIMQARQQRQNTQNAINAITTQMNTDLLNLRGTAAKEGVVEAVYGGQQAEVTREATIRLLPLQAQLASDQGNLSLAEEHLNTLFSIYSKDAQNSVDFYNANVKAAYEFMTGAEKKKADAITKQKDFEASLIKDEINNQQAMAMQALKDGKIDLYKKLTSIRPPINVNSPTFAKDKANYQKDLNDAIATYAEANPSTPEADTAVDVNSKSILAQTGLSITAFNYLVQGTAALTRLSAVDRKKYMTEAQDWAKKNNIDTSTFKSQYEAYNSALQNNIKRFNNTVIMEGELKGTIENLAAVADAKSFSKLKVANVAKLFAGQELNDETTLQYAVHLNQLVSELAGYNAAVQGRTSTDLIDINEAKRVIQNGVSSGSLTGFQTALTSSVEKMSKTLQASVDRTQKQVWNLFGVGKNFKPSSPASGATSGNIDYTKTLDAIFK